MKKIITFIFLAFSTLSHATERYFQCEMDGSISNIIMADDKFSVPGKTFVKASSFPTAVVGDGIIHNALIKRDVTLAPADDLRTAMKQVFNAAPDAYKVQFMGIASQIEFAFDNGQPPAIIRAIIVAIDPGDDAGLIQFKQAILGLPQWPKE